MWDKLLFEWFTDEQARAAINLTQRYASWIAAERGLATLPYDLRRKTVNGYTYLYEISDRSGNGKSLGAWSDELQARFDRYHKTKAGLKAQIAGARAALDESGKLCRALRLPMLASAAGPILREADKRGLLDGTLRVVGTNALAAYSYAAGGFMRDAPDETDDFDLAWTASEPSDSPRPVWDMLKAVDSTYTMNTERSFQARNAAAYEVELLAAPSRAAMLGSRDMPKPIPLPEQEWLLLGKPVDAVVICRDGSPARIVAPDPRYFALHKLWMADKSTRSTLKKPKDRKQGMALLNAVRAALPNYVLDDAFGLALPVELRPYYTAWYADASGRPLSNW